MNELVPISWIDDLIEELSEIAYQAQESALRWKHIWGRKIIEYHEIHTDTPLTILCDTVAERIQRHPRQIYYYAQFAREYPRFDEDFILSKHGNLSWRRVTKLLDHSEGGECEHNYKPRCTKCGKRKEE